MSGWSLEAAIRARDQFALADVRRADQGGLVQVGLVGQLVQLPADVLPAGIQPFAQGRLGDDRLAARVAPQLEALPFVEQHVHRLGVELLAVLRERAAALGLEPRHQGKQQGSLGQLPELLAPRGTLEHLGAGLGIRLREAEKVLGHVGVPGVDEALDLPAGEGEQLPLGESVELPVLPLIRIGAAGDEETAVPEDARELLDGLLDLLAPPQGVGDLVQPVQQDQPALSHQVSLQVVRMAPEQLRQLLDDESPQGIGQRGAGRGQIGGEVAQQHPHRQQRLVGPALGPRSPSRVGRPAPAGWGSATA